MARAEEELLRNPELASAVGGWSQACEGVEAQAVSAWRAAVRETTFWQALCRSPPPNALMMAVCEQKQLDPLETVFQSFLGHLADMEGDAWRSASSVPAYSEALRRVVDELLPVGDTIHIAFDV